MRRGTWSRERQEGLTGVLWVNEGQIPPMIFASKTFNQCGRNASTSQGEVMIAPGTAGRRCSR